MNHRLGRTLVSAVIATLVTLFVISTLLIFSGGCASPFGLGKKPPVAEQQDKKIPMAAVVSAGVLAVGGGVAAALAGAPAVGIPMIGAGATVTILGLTVAKLGLWVAGLGALVLLGIAVVILSYILRKYRSSFVDVVKTVQSAKNNLGQVFGKEAKEQFSKILEEQDPQTQALVRAVKGKESPDT